MNRKRFKLIGCKIFEREFSSLIYQCPNTIDTTLVRQDYHMAPIVLKQKLQEEIDRIDEGMDAHTNATDRFQWDAILIGYGLCAYAVTGLRSKKYPLVIPKAHDCIALVLGNKDTFKQYFDTHLGTCYLTSGYIELDTMPSVGQLERRYAEYMQRYHGDEETVECLMEIERNLMQNYTRGTFVEWESLKNDEILAEAKHVCAYKNWEFEHLKGSDHLLRNLLWGNWPEDEFVVVPPGKVAAPSYDDSILTVTDANDL